MVRECNHEGCFTAVYSKGLCKYHYMTLQLGKKVKLKGGQEGYKKPTPIPARSKKRAREEWEYSKRRNVFLLQHDNLSCACGCGRLATEVHHKRGRVGDLLLDERYWMAVCRVCHIKIEMNPEWAKTMGYSESRLWGDKNIPHVMVPKKAPTEDAIQNKLELIIIMDARAMFGVTFTPNDAKFALYSYRNKARTNMSEQEKLELWEECIFEYIERNNLK